MMMINIIIINTIIVGAILKAEALETVANGHWLALKRGGGVGWTSRRNLSSDAYQIWYYCDMSGEGGGSHNATLSPCVTNNVVQWPTMASLGTDHKSASSLQTFVVNEVNQRKCSRFFAYPSIFCALNPLASLVSCVHLCAERLLPLLPGTMPSIGILSRPFWLSHDQSTFVSETRCSSCARFLPCSHLPDVSALLLLAAQYSGYVCNIKFKRQDFHLWHQ